MKKLTILLLTLSVCLWAADFWTAKPYTDWSEKDVAKMLSSSPWSHKVVVTFGGGGGGEGGGGGQRGGKGGGRTPGGMGEIGSTAGPAGGGGGGGGMPGTAAAGSSGSRTEGLESMAGGGGGAQGVEVTVMWMSALPIKQAGVKKRYGSEAATSDEGKKILGQADPSYVLAIAGVPPQLLRGGDRAKDMMKEASMLAIKGKDPLKPIQVDVAGSLILLAFAKTNPIVPEDSEVEFVSKLGNSVLKCKFKLKDMQFDGRLAL